MSAVEANYGTKRRCYNNTVKNEIQTIHENMAENCFLQNIMNTLKQ
jgi:hypothetical protein